MKTLEQEQTKKPKLNFHKLIVPIYAIICLIEIPRIIKWGGNSLKVYFSGMLHATIAFAFPFVLAGIISFFFSKQKKESFLDLFVNKTSTILLILASLVLLMWYFFAFNFSF